MISQGASGGPGPAVTLDYSQAQLGQAGQPGELQPEDDDLFTRNDVQVQRAFTAAGTGIGNTTSVTGATFQAQLDDGSPMSISPPPDGVGDYNTQVSANVQSDGQLPDVAGWLLNVGTVNEQRYPVIPLNIARPELQAVIADLLDADLGDYIVINNPGAKLPPGPVKQLIYGTTERFGGNWFLMDWQCVPESPYEAGVLDDLILGRADTDGSSLHAGVTSTATALAVDTVNATSPLWTTSGADFPFDIVIGGERMTVTSITAAGIWLTGQDAGFEGGIGGWAAQGGCTIADSSAQAHSGSDSMAMTSTGTADMFARTGTAATRLPCLPGDTITVSGFFRAGSTGRTSKVAVYWQTSGFSDISRADAASVTDSAGGWLQASGSVTAPASAAYALAGVRVAAPGGAGEIHYVDDVQITNQATSQKFSVTRSINGVAKAQPADSDVRLYISPVLAVA